jgi:hypothetical protein
MEKAQEICSRMFQPFIVPIISKAGPHVFYSTADKQNVGQFVSGDSPQKRAVPKDRPHA